MLLASPEGARPRLIVEVVAVVPAVGTLLSLHGMSRAAALAEAGRHGGVGPIVEFATLGILERGSAVTVTATAIERLAIVKGTGGDRAVAAHG